jgi:hypothetical protein
MARVIQKTDLDKSILPGRIIWKAVGKEGPVVSKKMTVGFGDYYTPDVGPMEPHNHAEECVFIVDAKNATFRYGPEKDKLGEPQPLLPGMLLHFDELEWHVFEHGEGGFVEIIFIYGQVDNIRPEEIAKK